MDHKLTYSFIIPHYNIPDLLVRCINSIPQRDDIQIIVVDDGSESKPEGLRHDVELVLLPEHTNAGNARNVGLSKAKGRWVLFPDADDFYNPGFLNELDKYVKSDNEMVFFSINSCDSTTLEPMDMRSKDVDDSIISSMNGDPDGLNFIMYRRGVVWNIMFSHDFISKYDFRFESTSVNNDVLFHVNCCYHLKRYAINPNRLYCITLRKGSLQYGRKTLDTYLAHLCCVVKMHHFNKYVGIHLRKPLLWRLFYGYDSKLKKKTRLQRHINRLTYLAKSLFVATVHFKQIYSTRMSYVEEIKRSTTISMLVMKKMLCLPLMKTGALN